jgi:AcrR family transcriptional regulator
MAKAVARVNTLMYGRAMTERLTRNDWIEHGLHTLAREGANALKAGPMAAGLNVSRGSFYWHFRAIADFRAQLLEAWAERTTKQVILELEAGHPGPDRLKLLMRRAFVGMRGLDRAIRAWAGEDESVAAAVASVDAGRIDYIAGLLAAAGVERARAAARAAFIYWAYLGQAVMTDPRHGSIAAAALDELSDLFER